VLIAGWPQSLWAWRHVLPALATRYRVFAFDLPGMGDSAVPALAYDVNSVAATLHAAVGKLGLKRFHLVGHDLGAWVGYPFAALYRDSVAKLVLIDAVIPGIVPMLPITPQNANLAWHFGFNQIAELPEALTAGRERVFLSWFFKHRAFVKNAFTAADLDEYERVYSAPGAMTSGFGYYRSMGESARQNLAHAAVKLTSPVLVIAAAAGVGTRMIDAITPVCENARGVVFDQCGHYIPEEAPQRLCAALETFCV
jgi:pimeloyl-ACP methyl ester carboxylesterase